MKTVERILLIEDDADDQQLFCEALKDLRPSISCSIANNGFEGLDNLANNGKFDMVFLDLNMPKMNGYQFLKKVKGEAKYKNIPIIILSTSSNPDDIDRCKDLGASAYFTKPPSYEALFDELNNIFTGKIIFLRKK